MLSLSQLSASSDRLWRAGFVLLTTNSAPEFFASLKRSLLHMFGLETEIYQAAREMSKNRRPGIRRPNRSPTTDGGVWLGANPSLPGPGPRWCLRRNIPASGSVHRYSRPSNVSSLTLIKCIRRTADRIDPQARKWSVDLPQRTLVSYIVVEMSTSGKCSVSRLKRRRPPPDS
jgi:hypothetical protein